MSSFIDNYDFKCYRCSSACIDCMFNASFCLGGTCLTGSGRSFVKNQCLCDENAGFFDDGHSASCQKCSPVCLTCRNFASKCLSCNMSDVNRLDKASTLQMCPCKSHYFESLAHNYACIECLYSCKDCLGFMDVCTACPGPSNVTHRTALPVQNNCPCLQGFFDVEGQQICQQCHYSCLTCQ